MAKRSKFNVSKEKGDRTYDGIVFDSELEMRYYIEVVLPLYQDGTITFFERQKKYILQPQLVHGGKKIAPIDYKADFYIQYKDGREQVIDIKGYADATAKLKRKMFWYKFPDLDYIWIGYSKIDGGWVDYEDIQKNRKIRKKLKKEQKENGKY